MLVALVFLVCATVAWLEPIAGDCWFGVEWKQAGPSFASFWAKARWNYLAYTPRLGENFLYLTTAWPAIHVVLTPAMIVLAALGLMTLALGRLPRPSEPRYAGSR